MKKILFIIAGKDFRDPEYFIPRQILEQAGYQIFTASDIQKGKTAIGTEGGEVPIDLNIGEVDPADFDMIVFVGGSGALKYLDNPLSYGILKSAQKNGKFISAICIAPVILAKAGILNGRKATVWTSDMDKSAAKILEKNGAIYQKGSVTRDKEIITADGPASAEEFGKALADVFV